MHLFVPPLPVLTRTRASARTARRPRRYPTLSANDSRAPSWQDELRLLLDPNLNPSAKQVLLQDLAKRTPEIINQCSCTSAVEGLTDVARQISDVIPDIIANGPRYAADGFPGAMSRMRDVDFSAGMPATAEDVAREVRNVFNRTPEGLYTPEYDVLHEGEGYEIRKYPNLIVATTKMMPDAKNGEPTEVEAASAMGDSFGQLAGYLFGKNKAKEAMKMTTPVVLSKGVPEESMGFIIGEYQRVEDVPETLDDDVTLTEEPGRVYAVTEFSGYVTRGEAARQRERLLSMLRKDGIEVTEDGKEAYKCMIYNGPSTLPNLRRNEMMIEVVYERDIRQ